MYSARFTPEFLDQAKKYRHLKRLIEKKINLLCQDPYRHCKSEALTGKLSGLRSARLTGSFRLLFQICEEGGVPKGYVLSPKTLIFHTLGTHEEVYGK